jgi:glutaredoxin-like protein NrdH
MMDKLGVPYDTVDITDNPEELDKLIALGYRAAPVVVADNGESWAGFNPAKIEGILA